ncbi:hypothetical protein DPMN_156309 [Dreissena polymorpha]|uniref:Uncharacterized protein n=1 Tax=Dreissena polymorpha TaxID=45954 RepID=A0A9D4FTC3_DREPO|nr:hypothetical protein DPMN_156309 [Dreissena polymorpha]
MSLDQQHCTPFAESSDTIAWLQLLRQPGSDCQQHVVFEPDVLDSEDVPEPFVAQVSDCHLLSLGPDFGIGTESAKALPKAHCKMYVMEIISKSVKFPIEV